MATNRTTTTVGPLLHAMFAQDGSSQTDGQLLEQFLIQRNQAAFATLVRRHGAMVLGVCRRILGNAADADDAFQATFVVLLRKARTLTSRVVVGDWLHGVARRTALKARAAASRRRAKEQAAARPESQPLEGRNDWLPLLDQELSRLPQKYRLPIVLCDLEGKTIREAAQRLGWPEGTVAGRLARGRDLLAKRLLRGAQLLSVFSTATLTAGAAKAALPLELFQTTMHVAALEMAGDVTVQGLLSAQSLTLAKGVIQAMFWNKVKMIAAVLVAVAVLGTVGGRAVLMWAAPVQAPQQAASRAAQAGDKKPPVDQGQRPAAKRAPTELEIELEKAAQIQYDARWKEFVAGKKTVDFLLISGVFWVNAQLRLCQNKAEVVTAYQGHIDRMKEIENISKAKYDAGSIPITEYMQTVCARLEGEIWLDEARRPK